MLKNRTQTLSGHKGADAGGSSTGLVVPVMFIPEQFWEADKNVQEGLEAFASGENQNRIVVSRTTLSSEPVSNSRTVEFSQQPCDNSKKSLEINSKAGWRIDETSIVLKQRSFIGREALAQVTNVTPAGFKIEARLTPSGTCLNVFGRQTPVGPSALYIAELTFSEIPTTPVPRSSIVAEAANIEGLVLPLGTDDKALTFELETPNGKLTAFNPDKSELKTVRGYKMLETKKNRF